MTARALRELARQLVEEEFIARRFAAGTRGHIRRSLEEFLRWTSRRKTTDLQTLTRRDLMAYRHYVTQQLSKRSGKALTAGTIASRFRAVSFVFACLYRNGALTQNPCSGLEPEQKKAQDIKRRPLTRDEVSSFLEAIDTSNDIGLRDRTLFELIYSSGLRVAEAAALKVGDIDFDRRLMVVRGKFDRDRIVPISAVAHAFLLHYLGARKDKPESWLFPGGGQRGNKHLASMSVSERFRELLRRFNMDASDISTHSLRHATATHLLENGASIRHVQELLGHTQIDSTARYTHVMVDALQTMHRRYHPREHELYEQVDEAYERKMAVLLARSGNSG